MEMFEVLKKPYSHPKVTMILGKEFPDIPLEKFLSLNLRHEQFNLPDFGLFRLDMPEETAGTSIVYDATLLDEKQQRKPYLGTLSTYDLSSVIPPFLRKSSTLSESIDEHEVFLEVKKIHGKYAPLFTQGMQQ